MPARALAPLLALVSLLVPASASAAPLPDCPATAGTGTLTVGQDAVGHTVRAGETVETFDVEILGVLEDGIAPGRDLIIVDTAGPVIDAGAGGISAGMSGSPVYTLGGELIGAIAYGFATGPSSIGGVTPADDMLELESEPTLSSASDSSPDLTPAMRSRIAEAEGTSPAAVPPQMHRLKVPLAVSGAMFATHRAALERLGGQADSPFVVTGGASAQASITPTATVAAGDAFAAALSYGDVTAGAIGTVTYVCSGKVLAFGHPLLFSGPTLLGASRASILAIVDDPTLSPFKLGAITDPVGTVDLDRLQGIRGLEGETIPTIPVTQTTTALDTGATRVDARTDVVDAEGDVESLFADLVAMHSISNIDSVFNQIGAGSSLISFSIEGKRQSGAPWSLSRTNRWTSPSDLSPITTLELVDWLFSLQDQGFEEIDFTSVDVDVEVEGTERQYEFGRVLWSRNGGRFRNVRRTRAHPGERIRARIKLVPTDGGANRVVTMVFRVPRGEGGEIVISGGGSFLEFFGGIFGEEGFTSSGAGAAGHEGEDEGPQTFDELLASLRETPRNDTLIGEADFRRKPARVKLQDRVVSGFDSLRVTPVPRKHPRRRR